MNAASTSTSWVPTEECCQSTQATDHALASSLHISTNVCSIQSCQRCWHASHACWHTFVEGLWLPWRCSESLTIFSCSCLQQQQAVGSPHKSCSSCEIFARPSPPPPPPPFPHTHARVHACMMQAGDQPGSWLPPADSIMPFQDFQRPDTLMPVCHRLAAVSRAFSAQECLPAMF